MGGPYATPISETAYIGNDIGFRGNKMTISVESPVGKSLIGKTVGQSAFVWLPVNKTEEYIILDIK